MVKAIVTGFLFLLLAACSREQVGVYENPNSSPVGLKPEGREIKQPVTSTTLPSDAKLPDPVNPDRGFGAYGSVEQNPEKVNTELPYRVQRFERALVKDETTFGNLLSSSTFFEKQGIPLPMTFEAMRSKRMTLQTDIAIAFRSVTPTARQSPTETFVNGFGRCLFYVGTIQTDLDIFRVGGEFIFEKKTEHVGFSEATADTDEFEMTEQKPLREYVSFCVQKYWDEVRKDLANQIAEFALKETNRKYGFCDSTVGTKDQRGDSSCDVWFQRTYPCQMTKDSRGQNVCKTDSQGFPLVNFAAYRPHLSSYPPDFSDTLVPRCMYQAKSKSSACEPRIRKGEPCLLWERDGKLFETNPYRGFMDPITQGFYGKCDHGLKCRLEGSLNKVGPILLGIHSAHCQ
jgi:hypothetical protein